MEIVEINFEQYCEGCKNNTNDAYLNSHSVQEQNQHYDEIKYKIKDEKPKMQIAPKEKQKHLVYCGKNLIRNPKKYFMNYYDKLNNETQEFCY